MEVGGRDLTVNLSPQREDHERVLRWFRVTWPEGWYLDGEDRYRAPFAEARRFAPRTGEFFLFRNKGALTSWVDEGAREDNRDTMVHVLFGKETMTFVIDSKGSGSEALVTELLANLRRARAEFFEVRKAA